ncbi:reverse transcriptase domain-containing protein [Tanacetum coccineum]
MHTRASNSELVEPSPELEHILRNYNPMDDEPMWVADHVVVPTLGSTIIIPETANEFAIKGNHLTLTMEMLRNCHGHNLSKGNIIKIFYHGLNEITQEVLNAAAGGSINSDTDKIMARMDAMTMKMDAQYKDFQSRSKQSNLDDDDIPMSREEEAKFMQTFRHTHFYNDYHDHFANKQSGRPFGSLPSNTQPNPKGSSSKPYQPPQARNEHVNDVFTWSGKSYDPPNNPNDQQNHSKTPINFDSDDEDDEPTPQPRPKTPKPKEKNEAQYGKFLDMIRAIRINVPLVDVLAGMPKFGKFFKELVNNKHKIEQISVAFLSDESSVILQNKVPPKLGDPESFLIPCNFNKAFSCNALADLGASINLMLYSLYAKLSLETLKPSKMSVRLADRSFQYPVGIAENMLVKIGKFTFPADFVILEMEKDSKVPLILKDLFLTLPMQ